MHKISEIALLDLYEQAFKHGKKFTFKKVTREEMLKRVKAWKQSRFNELPNIKK